MGVVQSIREHDKWLDKFIKTKYNRSNLRKVTVIFSSLIEVFEENHLSCFGWGAQTNPWVFVSGVRKFCRIYSYQQVNKNIESKRISTPIPPQQTSIKNDLPIPLLMCLARVYSMPILFCKHEYMQIIIYITTQILF